MRSILVLVLMAGCLPKPDNGGVADPTLHLRAPSGMGGDAKIDLENDLQGMSDGSTICEIHLNGGPNLITPDRQLGAGNFAKLHLRPGHYRMTASTCAGEQSASDMDVRGWTIIHLGYAERALPPIDSATHYRLNFAATEEVLHPRPIGCIADNDWSPASNMSCCSDRTHWSRDQNRLVCGP